MSQRYQPPENRQPSGQKQSFWTTLPGILTATSTLIASIGGLIGALFAAGIIGGDDGAQPNAQVLPTATNVAQIGSPSPTPTVFLQGQPSPEPSFPTEPPQIDIRGAWTSQGGFSWIISQDGNDVEIASLDLLGTTYLGTRTGNFIQINLISDGFSAVPTSGSMQVQSGGDVINVNIGGVADVMVRQ